MLYLTAKQITIDEDFACVLSLLLNRPRGKLKINYNSRAGPLCYIKGKNILV